MAINRDLVWSPDEGWSVCVLGRHSDGWLLHGPRPLYLCPGQPRADNPGSPARLLHLQDLSRVPWDPGQNLQPTGKVINPGQNLQRTGKVKNPGQNLQPTGKVINPGQNTTTYRYTD